LLNAAAARQAWRAQCWGYCTATSSNDSQSAVQSQAKEDPQRHDSHESGVKSYTLDHAAATDDAAAEAEGSPGPKPAKRMHTIALDS
jgi:hypothetical protein